MSPPAKRRAHRRTGRPVGSRPVEFRPELMWRIAKAKRLRESGLKILEVAAILGISEFTLYPWLRWSGTGRLYPQRLSRNRSKKGTP